MLKVVVIVFKHTDGEASKKTLRQTHFLWDITTTGSDRLSGDDGEVTGAREEEVHETVACDTHVYTNHRLYEEVMTSLQGGDERKGNMSTEQGPSPGPIPPPGPPPNTQPGGMMTPRTLEQDFSREDFDTIVKDMTEKQKVDLCLQYMTSPSKATPRESTTQDFTALAQAITKGLQDGARTVNDNRVTLNKATERSSSTIEGLIGWLQQGENAERNIMKRIQLITSKSSECPWSTSVSETPPLSLSERDTWRWYVHRWCYDVRPDYVEYLETAVKNPSKVKHLKTAEEAKRFVTRAFNAYSWLQKLFPEEMGNVMATDGIKADMLMNALPQRISAKITPHLVGKKKTFQLIWQHALSFDVTTEEEVKTQPPVKRRRLDGIPVMASIGEHANAEDEKACQLCGARGHEALDCPFLRSRMSEVPVAAVALNERKCFNCGAFGHMAADCRAPRQETRKCFNCGKHGHLAKDCRSGGRARRSPHRSQVRCYNCNQFGHYKSECPQAPGGPPNYPPPTGQNSLNE